jgi:hypothetical protein
MSLSPEMFGCPPLSYILKRAVVSARKEEEFVKRLEIFFKATYTCIVHREKKERKASISCLIFVCEGCCELVFLPPQACMYVSVVGCTTAKLYS